MHRQACYASLGYAAGSIPVAEKTSATCVSLPIFPELTDEQVVAILAGIETEDPVERLRNLVRVSREDSRAALDVAMRDWAGSNDLAASAVRGADEQLLRFVERAFRDLGHDRAAARVRAVISGSRAGPARAHSPRIFTSTRFRRRPSNSP